MQAGHHHAIGGRAADGEAALVDLAQAQRQVRVSEWEAPDCSVSGATTQTSSDRGAGDFFGDGKARRMNAVVIGDQDAHQAFAITVLPPM